MTEVTFSNLDMKNILQGASVGLQYFDPYEPVRYWELMNCISLIKYQHRKKASNSSSNDATAGCQYGPK